MAIDILCHSAESSERDVIQSFNIYQHLLWVLKFAILAHHRRIFPMILNKGHNQQIQLQRKEPKATGLKSRRIQSRDKQALLENGFVSHRVCYCYSNAILSLIPRQLCFLVLQCFILKAKFAFPHYCQTVISCLLCWTFECYITQMWKMWGLSMGKFISIYSQHKVREFYTYCQVVYETNMQSKVDLAIVKLPN